MPRLTTRQCVVCLAEPPPEGAGGKGGLYETLFVKRTETLFERPCAPTCESLPSCSRPSRASPCGVAQSRATLDGRCARRRVVLAGSGRKDAPGRTKGCGSRQRRRSKSRSSFSKTSTVLWFGRRPFSRPGRATSPSAARRSGQGRRASAALVVVGGTRGRYRRSTDTIHMNEARFIATDGRSRTEDFGYATRKTTGEPPNPDG